MEIKEKIVEGLNDQQKAAVINYNGPTLIVAGAGSGKTRTITQRIAYMLSEGVAPEEILALTFTKKAAGEMKTRILDAVGRECRPWKITMGTFHSVFIRFLSEFSNRIGFPEHFTIYDESDSETLIKQIIKKLGLEDNSYKPRNIKSRISLAKNNLLTPSQYENIPELIKEDSTLRIPRFIDIFREYNIVTKNNGAMDFDDILLNTNALLRDNPDVRKTLGERYRYILVDEYQDTNLAQYKILKFLTEFHQNICVVGDDSQSIYSFRGAKIENILRFRNDYKDSRTFLLEQNYRSTSNIVLAANSVIEHNSKKLPKNLFSASEEGEKIRVFSCDSDRNEAATIAREIKKRLLTENASENDFAILYRNNFLSRLMEDELRSKGIPYQIYGGHSFYNRKEILDMVAYMKFCLNTQDDISLLRIINIPPRGIGDTSLERLKAKATEQNLHIWEVISTINPEDIGIKGKASGGLKNFKELIEGIRNDNEIQCASQYVNAIIERSHIAQILRQNGVLEDEERADNIESLMAAVQEWELEITNNPEFEEILSMPAERQMQEWLTNIALLSDSDTKEIDKPHVTLMTVHASKGLEFKYVYIVGVEENIFPSPRAEDLFSIEEERRIFYVALTRAKKFVGISWSSERFRFGSYENTTISRFVNEIDEKYLEGLEKKKRMPWDLDDDRLSPSSASRYSGITAMGVSSSNMTRRDGYTQTNYRASLHSTQQDNKTQPSRQPLSRPKPSDNAQKTTYRREELVEIPESNGLRKGTRVEHHIFGKGTVEKLELRGKDVKVTINFDTVGTKVLLERFGNLKRL